LKKRKFKLFKKNRKAVSPAISSVIMSAAIITVGLFVLSWANNSFNTQREQSSQVFQTQNQLISENFVIEDVWFYQNGVNVTVRNIGTINMTVTNLKFNGTNHLNTQQNIAIKEAKTIPIPWNWGTGTQIFDVMVETSREQSITEIFSTKG
jgi:hypothetical protein